jgi:hypothetical protein
MGLAQEKENSRFFERQKIRNDVNLLLLERIFLYSRKIYFLKINI